MILFQQYNNLISKQLCVMKLNWYLVNCGVVVCVHDDLIVLKSHHKLISSSWCLWPGKKQFQFKFKDTIAK